MGFGDLRSDAGLATLNSFLADKSYIDGWVPSQGDVVVYKAVTSTPKESFVHALRWYRHISSYSDNDRQSWPGVAKPIDQYGPVEAASSDSKCDNDDFDLFGSDSEEESAEAEKMKEERIAEYTARKSKKPAVVAKSSIILDVKPWDDETGVLDMADVERAVRSIEADGLLWGQAKLVPLAYGIKKLQIGCVVEDDKIGTDFLEEEITKFEDLVQSVDVAAFNKV